MLWSFIAVLFSGWLYVDASYRGPGWQRWLFKPITIALLLALAWQTPLMSVTGYFIVLGLLATLAADILLLTTQRMLFAIGAYSVCHLLYTIGFLVANASLTFFWPLPLLLLAVIALLLALLWSRLDTLRWPVVAFIAMNAVMVWVVGEQYFALSSSNNLSWFAGSLLLLIAHSAWLIHHYRFPFRAHQAIVAAGYFAGHFLIVRALYF
ncbi:MAG: lysoplasmalogenase [Symbiopectobacterium sp.]|uniref:lysoplasmalogenase n=1 Tax=Symbiopectobacterium sp. TaxID=2952789 RepID=UPI0039E7E6E0